MRVRTVAVVRAVADDSADAIRALVLSLTPRSLVRVRTVFDMRVVADDDVEALVAVAAISLQRDSQAVPLGVTPPLRMPIFALTPSDKTTTLVGAARDTIDK